MLCQTCKRKGTCKELCEAAEQYVSQDHVEDQNSVFVPPDYLDYLPHTLEHKDIINDIQLGPKEWKIIKKSGLTDRQKECVKKYFLEGWTQEQVSDLLGLNKTTVMRHIDAGKQKICNKIHNK